MKTIETPILINAEPWEVWEILMKIHEYENWNPLHQDIKGIPELDDSVVLFINPDWKYIATFVNDEHAIEVLEGAKAQISRLKFKVKKIIENEYLEWNCRILFGLFVNIRQSFKLIPEGKKTKFIHRQEVGGKMGRMIPQDKFEVMFAAVNTAFNERLKAYVEKEAMI